MCEEHIFFFFIIIIMALSVSYGIRKKDLDDYEYFTVDFIKEQDRQIFYFGTSIVSYYSVMCPLSHVEEMIKNKIRECVLLDHKHTGPLAFIFNVINRVAFCDANGTDYRNFLKEPHLIGDIITQAKKMLNKLCTLYNVQNLKNRKNLIQSYYRRNQRLYREQTIYLNSLLYGLRKDYPTVFAKSPYIIENTLSDCISEIFREQIQFRQKNSTDCGNGRKEWFRFITKYKYNLDIANDIKQYCLDYIKFMRSHGRIERKYMNKINDKVIFYNRFISTSSSFSSKNNNKRKMDDYEQGEEEDVSNPKKRMTDIDLVLSMKRYVRDNPNVNKTNLTSLLLSFTEALFENDDDGETNNINKDRGGGDDDDIGGDDDMDECDVINKCLKDNYELEEEEEEETSTYTNYKSSEDFFDKFSSFS